MFMKKLLVLCLTSLIGVCGSVSADVFYENFDLTGSTAELEVSGVAIGSGSLTANSGSLDAFLEGSEGNFTGLSLSAGSILVENTSFSVTTPFGPGTGTTSGFGFSFAPSSFTLSLSGGDTYTIGGVLNLTADMGSASFSDPLAPITSFNFSENEVDATATLSDSTITITGNPNDGFVDVSAALKFGPVRIGSYNDVGVTVNVDLSSTDTISFGGQMALIPEPTTFSLFSLSLLGLCAVRRKMRCS